MAEPTREDRERARRFYEDDPDMCGNLGHDPGCFCEQARLARLLAGERERTLELVVDYVLDTGYDVAKRTQGRRGVAWRRLFDELSAAIRALSAPKGETRSV